MTGEEIDLGTSADALTPTDILGTVHVRATAIDPASDLFIGVAPKKEVNQYLAGVDHLVITSWSSPAGHPPHAHRAHSRTGRTREYRNLDGAGSRPGRPDVDLAPDRRRLGGRGNEPDCQRRHLDHRGRWCYSS